MYETSNDLTPTTRQSAVELLNEHLADAIDLHLQAKQAHWNIRGPNFSGLHELFDRIAAEAGEYSDLIAERAVALGGVAAGTLQAVSGRTQLREYRLDAVAWRDHVRAMQDALATFGRGARKAVDDAAALNDTGTTDLFTSISRGADKTLWMVEAHLQETPAGEHHVETPSTSREASRR